MIYVVIAALIIAAVLILCRASARKEKTMLDAVRRHLEDEEKAGR